MRTATRVLLLAAALIVPACGGGQKGMPQAPGSPWMWATGSNQGNMAGGYGTKDLPSITNQPGARQESVSWTDGAGKFRLFGGFGFDKSGNVGYLSDLWSFDGAVWTWRGGSDTFNSFGTYGTLGVPAATNNPGGRAGHCSAVDSTGNVWMFGGIGYGASGSQGYLNDFWKFDGTNWTWISGGTAINQPGIYGTRGVPAAGQTPGAHGMAVCWIDASDHFWMFGGLGYDSASQFGNFNDLWRFDGTNWTWMSGASTRDDAGNYGTLGVPAASNVPGAREGSVSWMDAAGSFWVFGGMIYDQLDPAKCLNDLWTYAGGTWTWVGGASTIRQLGVYGALRVPSATNVPGARVGSLSWVDPAGKFWMFGGWGYDQTSGAEQMNDLWTYDAGVWTWMSGSSTSGKGGIYGNAGSRGDDMAPGGRQRPLEWTDSSGRFRLFGGYGRDVYNTFGDLNDVWLYFP